jgi:hypothetical protein
MPERNYFPQPYYRKNPAERESSRNQTRAITEESNNDAALQRKGENAQKFRIDTKLCEALLTHLPPDFVFNLERGNGDGTTTTYQFTPDNLTIHCDDKGNISRITASHNQGPKPLTFRSSLALMTEAGFFNRDENGQRVLSPLGLSFLPQDDSLF